MKKLFNIAIACACERFKGMPVRETSMEPVDWQELIYYAPFVTLNSYLIAARQQRKSSRNYLKEPNDAGGDDQLVQRITKWTETVSIRPAPRA